MIEGFKLDIPAAHVKAHLEGRAVYHTRRVGEIARQLLALGDISEDDTTITSNSGYQSLEKSKDRHNVLAAQFDLWSKYVVPDEIYRLSEHDLRTMEWTTSVY